MSNLDHSDTIGHIFTIDIKFHIHNKKTLLFNEIYPPIFKKKKKDPFEKSTLQLISIVLRNDEKEKINRFPTISALKEKKFITLYAEDIRFLVTRAGWLVTHIYAHYTFERSKFKKDFVIMHQKSCQTASSTVEKDFYKLLNNSNFGIDCRNNIDSCYLEPIYNN